MKKTCNLSVEVSQKIDNVLYTAMLIEVNRFGDCKNRKERQRIRDFIISTYQKLKAD